MTEQQTEQEQVGLTYAGVGVDYDAMDPFKRMCQEAAQKTTHNLARHDCVEVAGTRGESVYLVEREDCYLAHVHEGLGTKNLVADALRIVKGKRWGYENIAQCTVAMIVNDMVTLGALPISVAMHLAVGNSEWFSDEERCQFLMEGWKRACELAHCTWGGGETPTLVGIVDPSTCELSGSALGIIEPKTRLIQGNLEPGIVIMLIGSSGIHANGLTMARTIAEKAPYGYSTSLSDGRSYAEALLDPTIIYVPLIERCLESLVDIRYTVNITGHGWRKLMRHPWAFTYVIDAIPEPQPVFTFMQEQGPITDEEMYGNFNMGAGFALYVDERHITLVTEIAQELDMTALRAGYVDEARDGKKRVIIRPKNDLTYQEETLQVR